MKAVAVRPDHREFGLIEIAAPRRRTPTDVLLRVKDVGVCGTDKEICAFDYGTPPAGADALVIGHEALAEVAEVGPEVRGLAPGDLVVPSVRRACSHETCGACRAGRQDFCFTGDFTERGIKSEHGFMTEFVVEDALHLHRVPKELRDAGVLVEPLTIAQKALAQLRLIQQRLPWQCPETAGRTTHETCHKALVLGAGPVGLLGAMTLANAGFDTWVYSRERRPNPKAAVVDAIGAHYVCSEETPVEKLPELLGGIDVVYEAVGASSLAFDVMQILGSNGIFIFTGVPGRRGPIRVDADRLLRSMVLRNQVMLGTVNAGHETFENSIADLLQFQRRWPEAVRALITGRYPMEAHRDLLLGNVGGVKNVLAISE